MNPRRARRYTKVFILLWAFLASGLYAATGPDINFEETTYNFGIAGPGRKITHTFRFTNTGSDSLVIEKVSTDCGCTAALVSEKEIPPSGSGAIETVFETRRYEGKQEKTITVYSNDPGKPETALLIKGTIKRGVAVVPQGIYFKNVEKGKTASKRVRLLQLSSDKLILHKVEANDKYLTVKTSRFKQENSQGINIDITLKPDIPTGMFSEVITLHTNHKKRPRIDVPIWATVKTGKQQNK